MTIDEIYRTVQALANKEQRGYITPREFNLYMKNAQMECYNKRLEIITNKASAKKINGQYPYSLSPDLATQDLSSFLREGSYSASGLGFYSQVAINADYIVSVSILRERANSSLLNVPVDIVPSSKINKLLRSNLVSPTIQNPFAAIYESSSSSFKNLRIYPDINNGNFDKVLVSYYLNNGSPKWNYVTIQNKPVHDPTTSVNLKLPSRVHNEIILKILDYVGVSIRESELNQYYQVKNAEKIQQES